MRLHARLRALQNLAAPPHASASLQFRLQVLDRPRPLDQAEHLARRGLLPGLPAPAAAGGIGDSNGDPCPDAGDRVANIIIIVVVITATTSPIIFQGSSDLLRAPPKPLLRGVSGAPRAMAHAEAEVQDKLEAVVGLIGSLHSGGNIKWHSTLNN